jgi:phenylalanyl-tRNA synthetase beta chain
VKITYRWLQELTEVSASPTQLAAQLTMAGLEVESVNVIAPQFSGVVVGQVLETSRHPDAEKLSVCQVSTDGKNRLQIICGAANVRGGLKVAVAMVGARLPNDVTIKAAKLRGLESHGMLCSARELGLGEEHDGIMELADSLPLNENLRTALDLDDVMLEVNATPNRGDCMSVFGIARDYAAAQQRRYLSYQSMPVAAVHAQVFPVTLNEPAACPLFVSRIIRGVRGGVPSPPWLKERLRRVGINSISCIVDITNYVMMELGQPLHAYDLAKLDQPITVRAARAQERLTLLDDKEYTLDPEFLVIADATRAIGLAGIMGGRTTAISDATTDVLLEAAHFVPDMIAGRARRLGLFTDAGQRFERGVDPSLPPAAIERAAALLIACVGGQPGPTQITRAGGEAHEPENRVALRRARLSRLLGTSVPDSEVFSVLNAISGDVKNATEGWGVRKPTHRFDIRIEADLIEEVARLRGFDCIVETHASVAQIAGEATESRIAEERILTALADRGYREAITYAFVDPALQRQLFPDTPSLSLSNPLSADLSEMRVSLWTGLIHSCKENLRRQQTRVRLFEMGNKFRVSGAALKDLEEIETLAGIVTGTRWPEQWDSAREAVDFYDVKADVLSVLALAGDTANIRFEAESLPILRPGRGARIYRESLAIGWLGELHPQIGRALNLSATVFLFELEIAGAFKSKPLKYNSISRFPSVRRDLAIIVDESVPLAVLQENVTVSASGLLRELRVFDVYRGAGIETGRKSIALGLILQDSSRTLTDVDADAVVNKVVARLRDVLSATIRDQ